ncbi:MAG: hypothetical protein V4465_02545 [Patescibacteria group bacterium]
MLNCVQTPCTLIFAKETVMEESIGKKDGFTRDHPVACIMILLTIMLVGPTIVMKTNPAAPQTLLRLAPVVVQAGTSDVPAVPCTRKAVRINGEYHRPCQKNLPK